MSVVWVTIVVVSDASSTRVSLRSFWDALPVEGRWLLSTVAVQTLGRGLTLPFTIIYLNEVRGIPLGTAGVLMSLIFVTALVVTGPGGALTDRVGARLMVIAATLAQIVGCVVMAFATTPATVAVACVFMGFSSGVSWPAFNALVASVVTGRTRVQYFGVNFALLNLGIGLGGVVGGFYVDVSRPDTFTTIFLANAATMLVPLALMLGPLRHLHARAERPPTEDSREGSYLRILRRPAVLWITVMTFLGCFVSYGQMEAGVPAFARAVSEVSTDAIGIAFAVNTLVIVCFQFLVLRLITGRRRTRVLGVMALFWALSWLALGSSGLLPGTWGAVALLVVWASIFALGETMLQPTIPAITNDLAPDHLRGRYNAVSSGAFQGGAIAGPIAAGFVLEHGMPALYIGVLVVGCVVVAACGLLLERTITPEVNGVHEELAAAKPDAEDVTTTAAPATPADTVLPPTADPVPGEGPDTPAGDHSHPRLDSPAR